MSFLPQVSCVSQLLRDHVSSNFIRPDINTRTWILLCSLEWRATYWVIYQAAFSQWLHFYGWFHRMKPGMLSLVFSDSRGTQKTGPRLVTLPPSSLYCHLGLPEGFSRGWTLPLQGEAGALQNSPHSFSKLPNWLFPDTMKCLVPQTLCPQLRELKTCPSPQRDCYLGWEFTHMTALDENKGCGAPRWHPHVTLWSGSLMTYRSVTAWAALVPLQLWALWGLTCQSRQTALPLYLRGGTLERHWSADFFGLLIVLDLECFAFLKHMFKNKTKNFTLKKMSSLEVTS